MEKTTYAFSFDRNGDTMIFPTLKLATESLALSFNQEKVLEDPYNYRITEYFYQTYASGTILNAGCEIVPLERYLEQQILGLKESKDLVEAMLDNIAWTSDPDTKAFYDITKNKKISLIKFVRDSSIAWKLRTYITE